MYYLFMYELYEINRGHWFAHQALRTWVNLNCVNLYYGYRVWK